MIRDDIIRLAEEAGVPMERGIINGITYCRFHPAIERFANFVAAVEREQWIDVAEQALEALQANQPTNFWKNGKGELFAVSHDDPFRLDRNNKAITALQAAIRARGEP